GIESYGSEKLGQTGWFFSGTKISAAMAILFPVSLLYAIKTRGVFTYISIIINIVAMFITGTKTSYAGIIIGLLAAVFTTFIKTFIEKKEQYKRGFTYFVVLLLITVAYIPF